MEWNNRCWGIPVPLVGCYVDFSNMKESFSDYFIRKLVNEESESEIIGNLHRSRQTQWLNQLKFITEKSNKFDVQFIYGGKCFK